MILSIKSSTLGVFGLAVQTPAPPSVRGDGPGPRCRGAETFFGFIGPEVVFPALAWPNEPIDEASQTIQRPSLPKYGKNKHSGDANCQTGSRNMATTLFSTQRPRLSIRLQRHYGVYHLEPLQSCLPGVLILRHCDGRKTWQKYLNSERCFAITGTTGDTATIRAKIRHKQSSRVR